MICDCDGIFMWILLVHIWLWIYRLNVLLLAPVVECEQKYVIALPTIRNENRCGHVNYENNNYTTISFLRQDEMGQDEQTILLRWLSSPAERMNGGTQHRQSPALRKILFLSILVSRFLVSSISRFLCVHNSLCRPFIVI